MTDAYELGPSGHRAGKALTFLCKEGDTVHIGHRWRWPEGRWMEFGWEKIVSCRRCGAGFAFWAWPKGRGLADSYQQAADEIRALPVEGEEGGGS